MKISENLRDLLFFSSVELKRETAQTLHREFSALFQHDETFQTELTELVSMARQVNAQMAAMQLGATCHACATREGGGCCSSFMAGETDGVQILMNLIAGVTVDTFNHNPEECCYLGKEGCLFKLKPMFCLNYNCNHIFNGCDQQQVNALLQLVGKLLGRQYAMEQRIMTLITQP